MANRGNPDDLWKAPDRAYEHAYERLCRRADPGRIQHELEKMGVPEEHAIDAVTEARATLNGQRRLEGLKTLGVGVLVSAGGAVYTWISYGRAAENPDGGRYTIKFGAIAFGLVLIVRGLALFLRPAIRAQLGSAPYRRRASPPASIARGVGPSQDPEAPPPDKPRSG